DDGYAASVRPVPGTSAIQLCQGHCPVQHVAEEFPQLCEAEAQVFARLLGSHVQRLATLATGAHACTTNVPVGVAVPVPAPRAARPPADHDVRARGRPTSGETGPGGRLAALPARLRPPHPPPRPPPPPPRRPGEL